MDGSIVSERTFHVPVGMVTFTLTDIEGSTRLRESAADAMGAAVARHYELLDAAIALHGGVRPAEQGEGDSVVAAFTLASDAVAAALDVQRAFCAETWPAGAALKLRVALHTGEAQLRDEGNYFGRAVNRYARLREIGHGSQVVLSRETDDLVLDRLPDGSGLEDLGVHRLRDLGRPEHVFGLLPPRAPPPRRQARLLRPDVRPARDARAARTRPGASTYSVNSTPGVLACEESGNPHLNRAPPGGQEGKHDEPQLLRRESR